MQAIEIFEIFFPAVEIIDLAERRGKFIRKFSIGFNRLHIVRNGNEEFERRNARVRAERFYRDFFEPLYYARRRFAALDVARLVYYAGYFRALGRF